MATAPMLEPEEEISPVGKAMSDEELAAHLGEHETRAIGYFESEIASEQADALDRYYRRPYGDERKGRSKVVDATVAITVDNALAAILRPFAGTEETVVYEPKQPEDEDAATQATEYVNFVLHNDNQGFLIFHDWFKDALLQKVGVVKAYWEDYSRPKTTRLEQLDPMQIQTLMQSEKVVDGPFGPDENGLYVLDVERVEADGKLCIENIPPEEYRISPFARPGRVPPYEAHVTRKYKSELLEMGFEREVVMALSKSSNSGIDDSRAVSRYEDEQWASTQQDTIGTEANDLVDFNDEFVLIDYDGDGISELRRVMRSGNVILYNEEVEYSLFAKLCPVPMPHKVYGMSLADQVKDEQRIKTVLTRQTLDNLYLSNNPRPVVGQGAERDNGTTMSDLMSDAPGAALRVKDRTQFADWAVPFVADKSFPMLAYIDQMAESRTGISLHGQGMDPDALDKAGQVTATQAAIMEEGKNSRAEMIARIFAETGVRDLFRLMLKLLVEHQPRARMIRLRNKWVEMDPRSWNADMDVTISVGLGIGSKAQQMASAQTVLESMRELAQSPFADLIGRDKVYAALKRLFNAAGIKNVDEYLNEPQKDEQGNVVEPPPQPDPEQMKIQAEQQMQQAKMQMDAQAAQQRAAIEQMKAQAAAEIAAQKAQADAQIALGKLQLEREKAVAEAQMNQEKMALEMQLAERKMQMAEVQSQRDADRRDRETDTKLSQNRDGGSLDK